MLIFPRERSGGRGRCINHRTIRRTQGLTPRNPERLKTINGQMLQRAGTPQKQGEKC
ncbi:hypothetical protein I79_025128 [Cricetulus griseus]|uniref:Uncharacterized protein n=1 Tax=Cricetulus griseus TaxID=10029 RepID=G3IMI8_CRIGR|nr:hypothetical protein I79_025128 [Cricetulus griseus]